MPLSGETKPNLILTNSMRTLAAVERTSQEWWPIGTDDETESKESVLSTRFDDDDDDDEEKMLFRNEIKSWMIKEAIVEGCINF